VTVTDCDVLPVDILGWRRILNNPLPRFEGKGERRIWCLRTETKNNCFGSFWIIKRGQVKEKGDLFYY
jgi:hypothetical protein